MEDPTFLPLFYNPIRGIESRGMAEGACELLSIRNRDLLQQKELRRFLIVELSIRNPVTGDWLVAPGELRKNRLATSVIEQTSRVIVT